MPSKFWSKVLCKWIEYSDNKENVVTSLNDPIFNNVLITYRKEILFLPTCIEKGIITLSDFIVENRVLTQEIF